MRVRKQNMFAREEEYRALRQFVRLLAEAQDAGMAGTIRAALDEELTPRQKQLSDMYYLRQMRMQDIADELGLDISTVSRTLKRARERLRRSLKYGGSALLRAVED